MRLLPTLAVVVLAGCADQTPDPNPPPPAGDTGTPEEEFRLAHEAVVRLGQQVEGLRVAADPSQSLASQFPEAIPLARSLSAAQRQAGRLGYEVGTADPATVLGGHALFACLHFSHDGMSRRRAALDLAVRHHPDDHRLADYLYAVQTDRPSEDMRRWLDPVLDRLSASSRNPAVLAAAQVSRGRLLLASPDPAAVAAGERLLEAVARQYPDESVGPTRVAAWADGLLADHNRLRGGLGSPNVRLRP